MQPVDAYLRPGVLQLSAQPPLSLYVHLPWCLKKCPYCDFNSHALQEHDGATLPEDQQQRYLNALCADLEAALPLIWGRVVHSVFIGGGTPSLFAPAAIDRLLADIRARLRLEPACEITLEANPGTFERDRFRAFRGAGVTRLSVGVQSFNDRHLKALGRVHNATQARAAVAEAAHTFDSFNLDLMYALPGQTLSELEQDIETALAESPSHISIYQLTIEPGTLFDRRPPAHLPDDDSAYAMMDSLTARTAAAGLRRYEVSAYARDGHQCRHNLNYWQFGDYLGIGAGAHSKLTFPHRIVRQERLREPQRYMAAALAENNGGGSGTSSGAIAREHEVSRQDLPFEFMLNAMRLRDGVPIASFTERTGVSWSSIAPMLQQAEDRGFIARDMQRIWPTARGLDFLSDLQALFLPG